jgi:exosortase/archaeosortase family protein
MISLFLGEFYRLKTGRRLGLILGGFALALFFNLTRMSVLVWVAARRGPAAIAQWHDPTGVTILLACFFALWGLGVWLTPARTPAPTPTTAPGDFPPLNRRLVPVLTALLVWIALVEISVEAWYRVRERRLPPATLWTVVWPTNNPTFRAGVIPDRSRQILRYDEGRTGAWKTEDMAWRAVFLRWNPGRTALHLAQNHTPEICLTAVGHTLTTILETTWLTAGDLRLPFTEYVLTDTPHPVYVFYCLWDDRTSAQGRGTLELTYGNRLAPVLAGLRDPGQRSLEITLDGTLDGSQVAAALQEQLAQIIRAGPIQEPAGK